MTIKIEDLQILIPVSLRRAKKDQARIIVVDGIIHHAQHWQLGQVFADEAGYHF